MCKYDYAAEYNLLECFKSEGCEVVLFQAPRRPQKEFMFGQNRELQLRQRIHLRPPAW